MTGTVSGRKITGQLRSVDVIHWDTYQIAVRNGFVGTVDEWLATVKGEKGDKGDDGITPHIGENENWFIGDIDTGVKASGDEKRLENLEKSVADLLYEPIAISSFTASVSVAQLGATVDEVTLSWRMNKAPTALTLKAVDGLSDEPRVTEIDPTLSAITLSALGLTSDMVWVLVATDERDGKSSKGTSTRFLNGVYYGTAAAPESPAALNKVLSDTRVRSFTVNAAEGEYIWYALPVRLGECSFKVGGFEGGFDLMATQDYENEQGYVERYRIYRSANAGLGNTTVEVS